jgi:endoglucanase
MPADLSNGLRRLAIAGREIIVAGTGHPVRLRGVNRSGLEYAEPGDAGFLESAGISEAEIRSMVRDWGANIIRFPFNQDWALNGRGGCSAAAYLEAFDRAIYWTSRAGAYTLLDLQWIDADVPRGRNADGSINRVPALPTPESIAVWSTLAARYRYEPAVLFDVFNEPHDPIRDDPDVLLGIHEDGTTFPLGHRRVTPAEWQPWARHLVHAIRREHPDSLIFVSGVSWAYDLRGMPLTVAIGSSEVFQNVVYSTHVYPWSGSPGWARDRNPIFARKGAPTWREAFGRLSVTAPVFVAEWGGGAEHVRWGEMLVRYLNRLGVGWTAWSWSDYPRLVVDAQARRYEPTDFGDLVRRALATA